jgi:phage/plasmid-like protein (TIGR03299 family)
MVAAVTITNGKAEMAYVGAVPWHGLGNQLQRGAPIETWIDESGLNFRVLKAFARYPVSKDDVQSPDAWRTCDDAVVLFRNDNGDKLGIVSPDYKIVQPRSVIEFFRDLVGSAGMELETAGTLFGGKRLWAMARIEGAEHPVADARDKMKMNLLLATSLDGSLATTGAWIATRVVCNNTLQIGLGERNALKVKVRHSTTFDADHVKKELGLKEAESVFERTMREMRELADKRMREHDVVLNTARLFYPDFDERDAKEQDKAIRSRNVSTVAEMALDNKTLGSEFDGTQGTVFGWLNSVTQFVDHSAGKANTTADNRINSAWFGKGAEIKEKAYTMAKDYTPSLSDVISATNEMFKKKESGILDSVIDATTL